MPGCPRLLKEYKELRTAKPDREIDLRLVDESDIYHWVARLTGPSDTPYEGGHFDVKLVCLPTYPLAPPKVTFITPVFHPNVLFKTGEICLDILKPDAWTPAWTLQSVCRAVVALLAHPEADSPLNCDCGACRERARNHVSLHVQNRLCLCLCHVPLMASILSFDNHREPDQEWRHAWLPFDGKNVH